MRLVRTSRPADYGWQTAALRSPMTNPQTVSTALRSAPNDVIAFHSGYPCRELLPERLVRSAVGRVGRTETVLSQPPVAGLPELQQWFAQELAASVPANENALSARDVIVLPGTQSGLSSLFRALAGAGQPVLMESPTYWGAILAAHQSGVHIIPVPTGVQGPDPSQLERAFTESGSRVFYSQPNYANPTGAQWSGQRGREVVDVVRRHGAFLIEDDWAHDFGIETEPRPLAAGDDSGHVIYLRSLTKSVSPALRVGAVIARAGPRSDPGRPSGRDDVCQRPTANGHTGCRYPTGLANPSQRIEAATPVTTRSPSHQLARTRTPSSCGARTDRGLNLWAQLPEGTDLDRVVRRCETAGVIVASGAEWFPAEPTAPFIRLNYAGPNPAAFPEGARILGQILDNRRG